MKNRTYTPPSNRSFYILDGVTGVILALELHSILSGLMICFRWGGFDSDWYLLCSVTMMLLFAGFGAFHLSMVLWLILIGFNLCFLYHKIKLYVHHVYLYRRVNALIIQLLFLVCTAVCLIAMLDYARF